MASSVVSREVWQRVVAPLQISDELSEQARLRPHELSFDHENLPLIAAAAAFDGAFHDAIVADDSALWPLLIEEVSRAPMDDTQRWLLAIKLLGHFGQSRFPESVYTASASGERVGDDPAVDIDDVEVAVCRTGNHPICIQRFTTCLTIAAARIKMLL